MPLAVAVLVALIASIIPEDLVVPPMPTVSGMPVVSIIEPALAPEIPLIDLVTSSDDESIVDFHEGTMMALDSDDFEYDTYLDG